MACSCLQIHFCHSWTDSIKTILLFRSDRTLFFFAVVISPFSEFTEHATIAWSDWDYIPVYTIIISSVQEYNINSHGVHTSLLWPVSHKCPQHCLWNVSNVSDWQWPPPPVSSFVSCCMIVHYVVLGVALHCCYLLYACDKVQGWRNLCHLY